MLRPPARPSSLTAGSVCADYIAHTDSLAAKLEAQKNVNDSLTAAARDIEALATMAVHKQQYGDTDGAAESLAAALFRAQQQLMYVDASNRSVLSHAASAVATAQIFEAFLETGTLGARPTPSADWRPCAPRLGHRQVMPPASASKATPRRNSLRGLGAREPSSNAPAPQASPYRYNGLMLYLSDDTNTGYAGVSRVASAPDPSCAYLAGYQSRSSPNLTVLGWFATAVEGAMAYSRHVQNLTALDEQSSSAAAAINSPAPAASVAAAAAASVAATPRTPSRDLSLTSPAAAAAAPPPAPAEPATAPATPAAAQDDGSAVEVADAPPALPAAASSALPTPMRPAHSAGKLEGRLLEGRLEGRQAEDASPLFVEYEDSEWLLALLNAAHEIGKYATGRATEGDTASVGAARDVASALLEAMLAFDLRSAPLRRSCVC